MQGSQLFALLALTRWAVLLFALLVRLTITQKKVTLTVLLYLLGFTLTLQIYFLCVHIRHSVIGETLLAQHAKMVSSVRKRLSMLLVNWVVPEVTTALLVFRHPVQLGISASKSELSVRVTAVHLVLLATTVLLAQSTSSLCPVH